MKRTFVFLFGLVVAASVQAAIVYQGRLATAKAALTLDDVVDKKMTFRVYDEEGAVRWSTNLTVRVATDGSFSAVLDAPELTAAIAEDKAATIGLSIGNAPELQPRRSLLPVPLVERANAVSGFAPGADVVRLEAKGLSCGDLSVKGSVKVFGTFDTPEPVRLRECVVGEGSTLKIGRGHAGVSVFDKPVEVRSQVPSDGVTFVSEMSTKHQERFGFNETHVVGLSYVQFCKAEHGPVALRENFRVIFYPFRTDAK